VKKEGSTYIIAEAGVNHNGSLDLAMKLIDVAADAGADAVKFQTFKARNLVSRSAPKAEYQKAVTAQCESQFDMLRKLELDESAHRELIGHCRHRGVQFLSTPFDAESVILLDRTFDLPCLKIPSGEITNGPLLLQIARTGKPVILSTGMSTLEEIHDALGVLAFGFLDEGSTPGREKFMAAFASPEGQSALREKVQLLHCTTEYPAPFAEVNLRAMETLKQVFGLPVGYSDHTQGIAITVAAVARGAVIIEKHFTLDRTLPGPDHRASLEPEELKMMVRSIREVEISLGDGIKQPSPSELKNVSVARKSLVAAADISSGDVFTELKLTVKRPGDGVSPMDFWSYLGRRAERDYFQGEQVEP
jgi:N-acetylneuraminate synthase